MSTNILSFLTSLVAPILIVIAITVTISIVFRRLRTEVHLASELNRLARQAVDYDSQEEIGIEIAKTFQLVYDERRMMRKWQECGKVFAERLWLLELAPELEATFSKILDATHLGGHEKEQVARALHQPSVKGRRQYLRKLLDMVPEAESIENQSTNH